MKIQTLETSRKDENGNIIETNITTLLIPEENKGIRNKITGYVLKRGYIGLGSEDSVNNYEDCELEDNVE